MNHETSIQEAIGTILGVIGGMAIAAVLVAVFATMTEPTESYQEATSMANDGQYCYVDQTYYADGTPAPPLADDDCTPCEPDDDVAGAVACVDS